MSGSRRVFSLVLLLVSFTFFVFLYLQQLSVQQYDVSTPLVLHQETQQHSYTLLLGG